jgi:hypothetical protein
MSPKLLNSLLIVSSLVMYFYVIDPLYTGADGVFWTPGANVKSLLAEESRYDATSNGVQKIVNDANTLNKQYKVFDDKAKNTMMIMVPSSVNEIKLLSELTEIANTAGFALEDVSVKDKTNQYDINFSVKTTYARFKTFITLYEKSMRLLTLNSVSFIPTKDDLEPVKFSVQLTTYYMK